MVKVSGRDPALVASPSSPASRSRPTGVDPAQSEGQSEALITAGMLADRLRPLVLGGETACLDGTPMIPLHRATVSAIYQHLERIAEWDGEKTLGALEWALRRADERHAETKAELAGKRKARVALSKARGEQVSHDG